MATPMVLNRSLATGLGRPDLAFSVQPTQVGVAGAAPDLTAGNGGVFDFASRAPLVAMLALIGAYAAFAVWVRPHLA